MLANRGGLLAFDVGVGKTYTAIGIVAKAREEGWVKRPVVLVPNSIVWKWYADFKRVLPDFRVLVIGSYRKTLTRGARKGRLTSETDGPEARGAKWSAFQAGEYDVALLTYGALGRTRMGEENVRTYADHVEAIQREIKIRQRNAEKRSAKQLTERQEAILKEGTAAWVAEKMEIPKDWQYDTGPAWDDIGIDLLVVDEAQNYKNLYLPDEREGGVPKYMGTPGEGSNRAWQLDFRCAAVRKRTGGSGIVLLSATPAKNSPLEFYNLLQYIDHAIWTRMGIWEPEGFIDRYIRIKVKNIIGTNGKLEKRGCAVGFKATDELREAILRYGDFKTAEQVGLKLPTPDRRVVSLPMNGTQEYKYEQYLAQLEEARKRAGRGDGAARAQMLGLMAKMALVSVHEALDEGYEWKTADTYPNPTSPKFLGVARAVMANRTCGHIVFLDNVAGHRWLRSTLVAEGVPEARIAILNAEVAKAAQERQRIAEAFNGNEEEGIEPEYDVVIANAIAYEGIDLQRRTCEIHHVDLPWEPATLQQRDGRGLRQGNTRAAIAITYWFSDRSFDAVRYQTIKGKHGWMTDLLKGQFRDINNLGAQQELDDKQILIMLSRDPDATRLMLEAEEQAAELERRQRLAKEGNRMLLAASELFRNAEKSTDPALAASRRKEAEAKLAGLAELDEIGWPFAAQMGVVRTRAVVAPEAGPFAWEGLRVPTDTPPNPNYPRWLEFGRVLADNIIAYRQAGTLEWRTADAAGLAALAFRYADPAGWPEVEDDGAVIADLPRFVEDSMRYMASWPQTNLVRAPDAWLARYWPRIEPVVLDKIGRAPSYYSEEHRVPIVVGDRLVIAAGARTRDGRPIPPTAAGWQEFIDLAKRSELKYGQLHETAQWWWGRSFPRGILAGDAPTQAAK